MSLEQNKAVAVSFFERLHARDIPGALDLLSDDASYWILGRREVIPTSGTHNKDRMTKIMTAMMERFENGMDMTVKNVIAEGDQVALEVESYAPLKNGRVYNNQYHIRMRIRDGRIAEVREYLDTQHVFATWFA
ncbi:MAG TPA: nuclear transport factor 2 family protein [Povalibacter sp.]|nr:nuclear transport factor 2 family protein [Povalibacter sp.]